MAVRFTGGGLAGEFAVRQIHDIGQRRAAARAGRDNLLMVSLFGADAIAEAVVAHEAKVWPARAARRLVEFTTAPLGVGGGAIIPTP